MTPAWRPSAQWLAALLLALAVRGSSAAVVCSATPGDIEGPYYQPAGVPVFTGSAVGFCVGTANLPNITVLGNVYGAGTGCKRPLNGRLLNITVQVWQADNEGDYDNNRVFTDANCRATIRVGRDGRYSFTTFRPAPYGRPSCLRAPHIHIKVNAKGYQPLTTQLYFRNNTVVDCGCGSACQAQNPRLQLSFNARNRAAFFFVLQK